MDGVVDGVVVVVVVGECADLRPGRVNGIFIGSLRRITQSASGGSVESPSLIGRGFSRLHQIDFYIIKPIATASTSLIRPDEGRIEDSTRKRNLLLRVLSRPFFVVVVVIYGDSRWAASTVCVVATDLFGGFHELRPQRWPSGAGRHNG